MPEMIVREDGAAVRFINGIRREHPHLRTGESKPTALHRQRLQI